MAGPEIDSAAPGGPPLVLVVEDDRLNQRLFEQLCRSLSLDVVTADDGVFALERIAERRPDLVLLDLMLPRLDGFGVLAHLRGDPRTVDLPVILISAVQDMDARRRAIDLGVDDFLPKPFRLPELKARVEAALAEHRLLAELRGTEAR